MVTGSAAQSGRMRASPPAACGGNKVGIKISPLHPYAGIAFGNPVGGYRYLLGKLGKLDFAFVELMKRSPMFPLLLHTTRRMTKSPCLAHWSSKR